MLLSGEYEPSQNDRTREQVELYEATNGVEGGTFNGKPVIVLTFQGRQAQQAWQDAADEDRAQRHLRRGRFKRRRPEPSLLVLQHRRQSATRVAGIARSSMRCGPVRFSAKKTTNGGNGRTARIRTSPPTEPAQAVKSRCSSWSRSGRNHSACFCQQRVSARNTLANTGLTKNGNAYYTMESLTTLLFNVSGHIAYITLNRPAAANAVSLEIAQELEEVARDCAEATVCVRFADRCRADFLGRRG